MKEISIKNKKLQSIQRRHPWVFSGAIHSNTEEIVDGDLVRLIDSSGRFLAIGHFQDATIAIRILSFQDEDIDVNFYSKRIRNAWEHRLNLGLLSPKNNIFRLIHGEGDQLPGLVADFFNGVVVIQCHSIGMYKDLDILNEAFQDAIGPEVKAIYSKPVGTLPPRVVCENEYIFGTCETPHVALEDGLNINIDWVTGQKTGFFIDQRENRSLLGQYSKGKKVLNTFCYSGGFSLQALQHEAKLVHSLDSSTKALELTEENISINSFRGEHACIQADAMEYMKELETDYDIIVLDPPAFAKHRDKKHRAVQGYKRLNAHAIRQIKPGGIIFTFSCSQVIDKALFKNTVVAAAIEVGRHVRIIEQLSQPADHPISAMHPEGEYLKGLVIAVD